MTTTVGEQLKQARMKRGMTLDQVAVNTHIRKQYLEALESDQHEALPSAVQGRGFLRLYADLLDLPIQPLLDAWDGKPPVELSSDIFPPQEPPTQQEATHPSPDTPDPSVIEESLHATHVQETLPHTEAPEEDDPTSSRAIFREIGQKLRKQREALGLSLQEVERYTRLRTFYVQAMEEGRMDDLPSPVQGRGMMSNYATFLNLDEEILLLRFAEGLQARRIERLPKPEPQSVFNAKKRPSRQAPFWKRFLTPDLIFGVGVAAIILFFALWTAARISAMRTTEVQPTPPAISEILLTPNQMESGTPEPGTPGGTAISGSVATFEANQTPGADQENAQLPETNAPLPLLGATSTPQGTPTLPAMNKDPIQVYIIAHQRAWLRVIADDKVKFLGRVVPGNAYAFSASKRIELSTGNAAGLQVFYNQNDLGTLGANSGDVANLVFTADSYATPTLAFTATPTPTKPATLTPLPSPTSPATATITPLVP